MPLPPCGAFKLFSAYPAPQGTKKQAIARADQDKADKNETGISLVPQVTSPNLNASRLKQGLFEKSQTPLHQICRQHLHTSLQPLQQFV